MTIDLRRRRVFAVLLDIEGTTTPLSFVEDVLFPFARAHLRECLEARRDDPEMLRAVRALTTEHAVDAAGPEPPPSWRSSNLTETLASVAEYAEWLMDRDRKSPGLKRLQGLTWELGYEAGELAGLVFDDVPEALFRVRAAGCVTAIYSSGSELAQRRLFESIESGDLTPLITEYFDTSIGPKTDPASYTTIATALRVAPSEVLFVSDVTAELAAASTAGLQVALSVRPGNRPQADAERFEQIASFEHIV